MARARRPADRRLLRHHASAHRCAARLDRSRRPGGSLTRLAPHERPEVDRPADVDPDAVMTVFRVPKEMAGMRVDCFLQTQLKDSSRTRAKAIVKVAARSLEGTRLRPNARVAAGQVLVLWRPPWDEVELEIDIGILYEDGHIVIIDKPAGLPVHPSARYYRNTVVKMMARKFPSEHLVLAHRLDRETSGVLVLARTAAADRKIKKQFEARTGVEKSYLAITWGWPERDEFRVELPLERDPKSRLRVAMRVAAPGHGLDAATRVTVLERRQKDDRRYALVRCDLETGRQHQIRVHLKAVGCPVLGDKIYGPDSELHARFSDGTLTEADRSVLELSRHALHAARLVIRHPISDEPMVIEAPLPADMRAFLDALDPV
ncbi:MAG: RluA family pseudouridine synthase [Deltaproteobacteria bacterium]|nr:RluA family pseudouridine synthase [Deltaproteobacteria bacterium]